MLKFLDNRPFPMPKKIAFINGGSGEIGKAIVKRFLRSSEWKVIVGTRNVEEARLKLASSSQNLQIFPVSSSSMEAAALSVKNIEGYIAPRGIDAFVNAAGSVCQSLIVRLLDEDLTRMLESNLSGAIRLNKAVVRSMLKSSGDSTSILNIGSVVGSYGNSGQVSYSASKAGLIGMTHSLAKEVGRKGIRVNLLEPGLINSKMVSDSNTWDDKAISERVLLQRTGSVDEVANLAFFLSTSEASYITNQVMRVDGGLCL